MTGSLEKAWDYLNVAGQGTAEFVRLRLKEVGACALYVARRVSDGLPALILEVPTRDLLPRQDLPDSQGLRLSTRALSPGPHGTSRMVLSLTEPGFEEVFRSLADDLVRALASAESAADVVALLVARLVMWQEFLRRFGARGMSREAQLGLFGELVFLRDYLLQVIPPRSALDAWAGGRRAAQDFQTSRGSVEVKTTAAATPHSIRIANLRQLDDRGLAALFVCLVQVSESDDGSETLSDCIGRLRQRLLPHGADFTTRLLEAGYVEAHRDLYQVRYSVDSVRFYRVGEGFPRLLPPDVPDGVEEVAYSVALAGCREFVCTDRDVLDALDPEAGSEIA